MDDRRKTREQLTAELAQLREKVAELEQVETEHQRVAESLKESEEKYRVLYENTPVSYQSLNDDGTFKDVNPAWLKTLGYDREEVIGKNFADFLPPDSKPHYEKNFPAFKQRGYVHDVIFKIRHKDGHYLDISFEGRIGYHPDGSFKQTYCVFQDITERKQMEEALKEKTNFAGKIIQSSALSTWISDEHGTAIQTNPACLEFFGATEAEVIGKYNLFKDEVIEARGFMPDIRRVFEKGEIANIVIDYNLGAVDHVDVKKAKGKIVNSIFTPILDSNGQVSNVIVQTIDLTDIEMAKETIRLSEARYRELVNTITSGVSIYKVINDGKSGKDYIIRDFNRTALDIEGMTREEVLGKSLFDLRPNIDDYGLIPIFRQVWKTGEPAFFPAKEYVDRKYANFYENRVFRLPTGEIVTVYDDVTERENAILEIREGKERFDLAMKATEDGVYDWNLITNEIYYSPGWKRMLGYEDDELPNDFLIWETLTDPEDVKKSWAMLNEIINKERDHFELEFKMKHKEGQWVDILSRADAVFDETGKAVRVVGTHVDITESKRAEAQLKLALADKETLLQELYHRTKNNMQVIIGLVDLQAGQIQDEHLLMVFKEIKNRIRSMALVHQKLYQSQNLSSIDLGDYIRDLTILLMESYQVESERISPTFTLESIPVLIDIAAPCGLILTELVSNVLKHAFPDDDYGELRIDLEKTEEDEILLQVSDNGVGLPVDFDPEKSDSVGLQIVSGIAKYQLQGKTICETTNGVTWRVQFNDTIYRPRV